MAQTSAYVAEFVGTFILMFTVGCVVLGDAQGGGGSIGCSLMVGIYALGKISGAHFNPAVSFAAGIAGKLPWKEVPLYWVVQFLGGTAAAFLARFLFSHTETPLVLGPAEGFTWKSAGACELIYTFMLCFVVLNTACSAAAQKSGAQFYGLSIGLTIVAGAFGAGAISGGCFNPAVAFGVYIGGSWSLDTLRYVPIYFIFELGGGGLAAILFTVVRPKPFEDGEKEAELPAKMVSEFLGTYMLVLTVGLNVLADSPAAALSIASSLMVMIFALADVSGGHFNPAVTMAILAIRKISPKEAVVYMATQVCGGLMGSLTYWSIYGHKGFALGPNGQFGYIEVSIAEGFFTGLLCFVVISVACSPAASHGAYTEIYGLAIGACIIVGGVAIGSVSGGSLNPAVSLATFATGGLGTLHRAAIYAVFEVIGAGAAALIYFMTHEPDRLCPAHETGKVSDSDSDSDSE